MKTEPLPSPKSSMKSIPKVTRGFISTHISCWLRNSHHQLSRRQLRIHHRNTFQRWRVDSEVLAAPVDWKKVNENWVAADSEIIIETALKGDTWIRKCSQPLLNEKLLMKTEPLLSLKSSTKSIPKVTLGFVSAHNPCWLRNSQHQLCRYRLRYHHLNTFQKWGVDSEALAAPVDSEKVNKNWVCDNWEIINWNNFQRWRVDLSARLTLVNLETVNENWATTVFEIFNEIDSKGYAWIRQRPHPLGLRNSQWQLSHYRLRNHHLNTFERVNEN